MKNIYGNTDKCPEIGCREFGVFIGIIFDKGIEYKILRCADPKCDMEWWVESERQKYQEQQKET